MPYPVSVIRFVLLPLVFTAAVAALPARGQAPNAAPAGQAAPQLAPPKAYKPVPVTLPQPYNDASFVAFRKQLADITGKKDRAALAKLIAGNFFWLTESGDKADKKKSGIDNLAAAMELDNKDGFGWEALTAAANEPTLQEVPERKGVMCSPAMPTFDEAAAEKVAKDTGTDPTEWGYVIKPDVEVREAAKADAPVVDKLGQNLVRFMPQEPPAGAAEQEQFVRVVAPSGKVGFVRSEFLGVLGSDQVCYIKDGGNWKIAGYAGSD
ncbi:MAG: hypothetical protein J2P53_09160 [Bradyrhizobiaceae bacterium]|nr:hypothetical protein [Bradyrhizobiaceae bacterium]